MNRLGPYISLAKRAAIIAAVLITVPWLAGAAIAATGVGPVVPPPAPDAIAAYLTAYGWIVGGITLAYLIVGALLKKYAGSHWLAQGKRLAYATAGLGVAWTALKAYTAGTPISGVIATAVLGLLHIADAQVTPASERSSSQGGFARLNTMLMLAAVGVTLCAVMGCGPKSTAVLDAALDCTTQARADIVAAMTPTAESAIQKVADPNGKITLAALEALFSGANLKTEAGIIAACVEAKAIAALSTVLPPGNVAVSALSGGPGLDVASLRIAFAQQFPGANFRTAQ